MSRSALLRRAVARLFGVPEINVEAAVSSNGLAFASVVVPAHLRSVAISVGFTPALGDDGLALARWADDGGRW